MFSWKSKKEKLNINEEEVPRDKYLDMAKNSSNWRKFCFIQMIIIFLLVIGVINISKKNSIETFVLEKTGNEYTILGNVQDLAINQKKASDEQVIYFLNNFINMSKSMTPSVELYKKNYSTIVSYMNQNTASKLEMYLKEDGYLDKFTNKKTVEIIFNTGIKLGNDSYQVRWVQRTFNNKGEVESTINYMAIFTIEFIDIKDKTTLLYNPLGILITDYKEKKENI